MSYVIQRNEDCAFVAPPGSPHSYTKFLQHARRFATREQAQREACGNESVRHVEDVMRSPQ